MKTKQDDINKAIKLIATKKQRDGILPLIQIEDSDGVVDLDIPTQRENVWDDDKNECWMTSLLNGIHVNPLYINNRKQNNADVLRVIDGKQRFSAVKLFVKNKFKIKWTIGGNDVSVDWDDIKSRSKDANIPESERNEYSDLKMKIERISLRYVEYVELTDDEENSLFKLLNQQADLSKWEKVYCNKYPEVKYILRNIYDLYFPQNIKDSIFKAGKKNKKSPREKHLKELIHILILLFGPHLTKIDPPNPRELDNGQETLLNDTLSRIIKEYKNKCKTNFYLSKSGKDFEKEFLKQLENINADNGKSLKDVCEELENVLETISLVMGKKLHVQVIKDVALFFGSKFNDNTLTPKFVKMYENEFEQFIKLYKAEKVELTKKRQFMNTSHLKDVEYRFNLLNKVFDKFMEDKDLDGGKKNKLFPLTLNRFLHTCGDIYGWKDPYDANAELEHVNHYPPKVVSSKCVPILVSEKTNLSMSDTTPQDKKPIDFEPMKKYYENCCKDILSKKVPVSNEILKYFKKIEEVETIINI